MKILVYGIGNCMRGDDGIGWYAVDYLKAQNFCADFFQNYQLAIEDVELITKYDQVFFIDAAVNMASPFELRKLSPASQSSDDFSTHSLSFESLLLLAKQYYHREPTCYLLAVQGQDFSMRESITPTVKKECQRALERYLLC